MPSSLSRMRPGSALCVSRSRRATRVRCVQTPGAAAEEICVVEEPADLLAIERAHGFRGRYHVLHGTLAPLDGIGPDDLKIQPLLVRLRDAPVREVILATNPTAEGEATALYLAKLLKPLGVQGDADRPWPAGRCGPRVCRRDDCWAGARGPAGDVTGGTGRPASGSVSRWLAYSPVAQSVERSAVNRLVAGSSPARGACAGGRRCSCTGGRS